MNFLKINISVFMAVVFLFLNCGVSFSTPVLSLKKGSTLSSCMKSGTDKTPISFQINIDDENEAVGLVAWSQFVEMEDGLISAGSGGTDVVTCLTTMENACCNYCSGFNIAGSQTLEYPYWQYGYIASSPGNNYCTNPCGSSSCYGWHPDGTKDIMTFKVKLDVDYWLLQPEGVYYRSVILHDTENPANQNIYTCCDNSNNGGTSGINCADCGGICKRLGYDFHSTLNEVEICIDVDHDILSAFSRGQSSENTNENQENISFEFEEGVGMALSGSSTEEIRASWGTIKNEYLK